MEKEIIKLILAQQSSRMLVVIGFFLMLSGGICNMMVVSMNDGKMPVIVTEEVYQKYKWESPIHSITTDESGVNRAFFADRFLIDKKVYSIGDFLIFFGLSQVIIFLIISLIEGWRIQKWLKS